MVSSEDMPVRMDLARSPNVEAQYGETRKRSIYERASIEIQTEIYNNEKNEKELLARTQHHSTSVAA
jgi:hypothetical protein